MDKKFAFQIFGLLIVIFGAMIMTFSPGFLRGLGFSSSKTPSTGQNQVTQFLIITDAQDASVQKASVSIEVAETKEKRTIGLSGRSSLPVSSGMLFILDQPSKPTFWMKGMQISLDFIWILNDQVVDILENVPPPEPGQQDDTLPKYAPVTTVDKVLEVNAGFIRGRNIKIGDRVEIIREDVVK